MSAFSPTIINAILRPRTATASTAAPLKEITTDRNTSVFIQKAPKVNLHGENTISFPDVRLEINPCSFLDLFTRITKEETGVNVSPFVRCTVTPGAPATLHFQGKNTYELPVKSAEIISRYDRNGKSSHTAELNISSLSSAPYGDKSSLLVTPQQAILFKLGGIEQTPNGSRHVWKTLEVTRLDGKQ